MKAKLVSILVMAVALISVVSAASIGIEVNSSVQTRGSNANVQGNVCAFVTWNPSTWFGCGSSGNVSTTTSSTSTSITTTVYNPNVNVSANAQASGNGGWFQGVANWWANLRV